MADELLNVMKNDNSSQEFLTLRVKEILECVVFDQKELIIAGLMQKIS